MKSIVGRKMGMTQVFATDGTQYPVTVIEVLPNVVTQIKTKEKDGYEAVQVGYEDKKEQRCTKPELGVFKKAGVSPKYELVELRFSEMNYKLGDEIKADIFSAGEVIDVIGTSKGHGFTGAIKRWHFHIGPKGHGAGFPHRGPGSMATNGRCNNRIHPGKKMAGHHGDKQATILNLSIVAVDLANNAILVKGSVPGPKKSIVVLRSAVKKPNAKVEVKEIVNYKAAQAE